MPGGLAKAFVLGIGLSQRQASFDAPEIQAIFREDHRASIYSRSRRGNPHIRDQGSEETTRRARDV
jgi:hypothetical protein